MIIRSINAQLDNQHLTEILKETIVLTRIKCENLFQGVIKYFIENKQLFLVLDYYTVCIIKLMTHSEGV